ncbi:MAG: thiamine phosphate synthase [Chloroflexota bacterium]|nr:thiamine phosphate synthase [Chloroflexota bacterium]
MPGEPRPELPRTALVLITDSSRHGHTPEGTHWLTDVVREAVFGGVNIVQLREKHLSGAQLIELGLQVRDALSDAALFFVNGDVDAAIALGADGIHLPEHGPHTAAVRARVGSHMLISRAVHSTEAAAWAEREGADLVQFGTLFETASKPGAIPAGIDEARRVCNAVGIHVIAVGGITPANAREVMDAGAAGVAVIGAILDASDPRAAAEALSSAIGRQTSGAVSRRTIER